jgi:hypothetical protein
MARLENVLTIPRALRLFARKRVRVNCLISDTVGKCVYPSADKVGEFYQVRTANPSDTTKMPAFGIIISKSSDTEGIVQLFGEMDGTYSGLTVGRVMFVGDNGNLNETPPIPPVGEYRFVQTMGANLGSSVVMLNPSFSMVKRIG